MDEAIDEGETTMAKRRKRRTRRASNVRRASRRVRRRARRFGKLTGVGNSSALVQLDAMAYGGLRARTSNALSGLTSRIPAGELADELGMGVLNWFIVKNTGGMFRNIAMKGLVVENARVGEFIANRFTPQSSTSKIATSLNPTVF